VHARLVEDDVRKFREAVLDVPGAVAPDQGLGTGLVGLPEGELVDPIGFPHDTVGEAKRLEHLHCPAGDAVGLADQKAAGFLLDDAGRDVGERGELRGEGQTSGAATDDEDVDARGEPVPGAGRLVPDVSFGHVWIAGPEPVEMELHACFGHLRGSSLARSTARHIGNERVG
jgi:hypothetical protein